MLSNKVSEIMTTNLTKAAVTASVFEVMQTMVALLEKREDHTERRQSLQRMIATPIERSNPPPPPKPNQPNPPDGPEGRPMPFWTWFIENPRPRSQKPFPDLASLTLAAYGACPRE